MAMQRPSAVRERWWDWLELHLSNQRPSKGAAALLKRLAKAHNNPELAEGLEGTWRREQIAAIVREMFSQ